MIRKILNFLKRIFGWGKLALNIGDIIEIEGTTDVLTSSSPLESELNSKYPLVNVRYKGRPLPKISSRVLVDVRNFITPEDSILHNLVKSMSLRCLENDRVLDIFNWVRTNIIYRSDSIFKGGEYYQFPYETIYYGMGDCEDQSILLYNLLLIAGIPYYKIRLSFSYVDDGENKGNHCFVTYFDESRKIWVLLDTCYHPNDLPVCARPDYKNNTFYKYTVFSWNQKYCFKGTIK